MLYWATKSSSRVAPPRPAQPAMRKRSWRVMWGAAPPALAVMSLGVISPHLKVTNSMLTLGVISWYFSICSSAQSAAPSDQNSRFTASMGSSAAAPVSSIAGAAGTQAAAKAAPSPPAEYCRNLRRENVLVFMGIAPLVNRWTVGNCVLPDSSCCAPGVCRHAWTKREWVETLYPADRRERGVSCPGRWCRRLDKIIAFGCG